MKKTLHRYHILHPKIVIMVLILFLTFISLSCENKTKENEQNNLIIEESNSSIDFTLLSQLNETNFKIIEISDLILNQTQVEFPNSLILKIKNDHTNIQHKLKTVTEENLIITPKPIYSLDLNEDVIKNDSNGKYTLAILEKTILYQVATFKKIEKAATNDDFTELAQQAIPILIENKENLSHAETN
jgi:hypothetical protein